jgi:hypothetical protein
MKTYFTKYFPIEGVIQVGDKLRSESCSKHAVTVTHIEDDIYWTDEPDFHNAMGASYFGIRKEKAVKLGPLIICSTEIKIGDTVIEADGKEFEWTRMMDNTLSKEGVFRKVGEISKDALWVKEGMEFDREELKIWKSCDSVSSKQITEAFGGVWTHKEDRIVTPGKVMRVEVKCPCCKTFK